MQSNAEHGLLVFLEGQNGYLKLNQWNDPCLVKSKCSSKYGYYNELEQYIFELQNREMIDQAKFRCFLFQPIKETKYIHYAHETKLETNFTT